MGNLRFLILLLSSKERNDKLGGVLTIGNHWSIYIGRTDTVPDNKLPLNIDKPGMFLPGFMA